MSYPYKTEFGWTLLAGEPLLSFTDGPCWYTATVCSLVGYQGGLEGPAWDALEFA